MGTRDLKSGISVVNSLAPLLRTATANGTGVDTRGFDSAMAVIKTGAGTDGVFAFTVQDSDDDGSSDAYAAVAAAQRDGTLPTVDADSTPATGVNTITKIGLKGVKRYVRVVATQTASPGPSTGCNFSADIVLGHAHQKPVS